MSHKNNNVTTKEATMETKAEVKETTGNTVENPPAAVETEKKSLWPRGKEKLAEAFDEEKHPIRNKVGKGVVKGAKVVGLMGAGAALAVGALALAGSEKKDDDSDEEDEYDSYDESEDEDVIDSTAEEVGSAE